MEKQQTFLFASCFHVFLPFEKLEDDDEKCYMTKGLIHYVFSVSYNFFALVGWQILHLACMQLHARWYGEIGTRRGMRYFGVNNSSSVIKRVVL